VNDFEPVVFAQRPDVREMREALGDLGARIVSARAEVAASAEDVDAAARAAPAAGDATPIVLMSGSGATVALLTPMTAPQVILSSEPGAGATGRPRFRFEATLTAGRVAAVELAE
jgi:4-diphosphocytidyl-2C-methyl-D-erythritol kinase